MERLKLGIAIELAVYEGMKYVIVNGKVAIDDGKYTGAMADRALRKMANGE